ncbi:quinone oxidoreductase family protein [Elioraea sp.]|uniref:quinone oxidoreductase family protein n=1 Tax=Elioraea sp. TaxID=2185103 RepID=UPI003F6F96E7
MHHAIRIHEHGGPEVMKWEQVPTPSPGAGEALVRHAAVGLNYIDVYFRTGLYKPPSLPCVIGMEGAGTVEAVGEGVTVVAPGDRVAYATAPIGAYAEARTIKADRLVKLPDDISFEVAAAMMLQGMTVEYLLRRTFPVKSGQTILVHAAAGGVGLIMCQWAKHLGATVIGTVGSDEKAALARAHGCDHPIVYTKEDFQARVKEITGGKMLPVVYDSVGRETFMKSLDCLAPLGMMVVFGNASGAVPPFDVGLLAAKGSLFLTRPTLATYTAKRDDLVASANALFEVVRKGAVTIEVNQRFPLKDAAEAHRALEARRTTGSTVLLP